MHADVALNLYRYSHIGLAIDFGFGVSLCLTSTYTHTYAYTFRVFIHRRIPIRTLVIRIIGLRLRTLVCMFTRMCMRTLALENWNSS